MCESLRKTSIVVTLLAMSGVANAALTLPPPPPWWQVPPPPGTRLQYHSFHSDPNLNMPPDWTAESFVPPQPDLWTMPGDTVYNQPVVPPWAIYWPGYPGPLNDNTGAYLPTGGIVTKRMGNLRDDLMYKEFYALIIWTGSGTLNMSVSSEAGTTVSSNTMFFTDGGMNASIIEGTITPQPDWELFTFTFSGQGVYLDEAYIGTHCVPEPVTMALLVLGGLLTAGRRSHR